MKTEFGKTKVIVTLGPSSNSMEMLSHMILSGVDVVRMNFSHGKYEDHLITLRNVQKAMEQTGRTVAVLQDLQGPKIRIREFTAGSVELKEAAPFTITTDDVVGDESIVSTTYNGLPSDVNSGDTILLDDGKLRLEVVAVKGKNVECKVMIGGILSAKKGINLPGVAVSAPSLTEKDISDLEWGIKQDVDYVALSFVRTAEDIRELRKAIVARIDKSRFLPIIAKIEKPQAVQNIDEIIADADGIMIARGDLGVELSPEEVPLVQKAIIRKCNAAGKPVIIATQMLESMIQSATPTRAEVSDVANAVIDGGDAVMLSGETSVGKYPLEAVRIMERIIRKVEAEKTSRHRILDMPDGVVENRLDALGRSACVLAEQMKAAAIVTVTHSGHTARVVSRYRPGPTIIAITDRRKILRRMNLIWGVQGMVIEDLEEDSDTSLQKIQERLISSGLIQKGEYFVLLAGQPFFARGSTNFIKVERIG